MKYVEKIIIDKNNEKSKYITKEKTVDNNFQRKGEKSNTQLGNEFEFKALDYFMGEGIVLEKPYKIEIGLKYKKVHKFDLGNDSYLVECKSMKWTESGNIPNAKLKNWSEAIYYFSLAPKKYTKIFFVEMDYSQRYCKTLLEYYIGLNYHLIPDDIIFYDYYIEHRDCKIYTFEDIEKMIEYKGKNIYYENKRKYDIAE